MTIAVTPPLGRDCALTGDSSRRAVGTGLAAAEWHRTEVPRKATKELMARTNGPALRDTAFRSAWMTDWVYHVASFQVMRNPVNWRWSHARHHTDTIVVGRDAEIAWMHPLRLGLGTLAHVGVVDAWASLKVLGRNALGRLSADERDDIPETEWPHAAVPERDGVAGAAA